MSFVNIAIIGLAVLLLLAGALYGFIFYLKHRQLKIKKARHEAEAQAAIKVTAEERGFVPHG